MLGHELIVVCPGIGAVDTLDLFFLAGTERHGRIEAPDAPEQPLPPQDLVKAGNATRVAVGRIEEGGVGVGDFGSPAQQALGDWDGIKSQDVSRLNASLKQAGLPPISVEGGRSRRNP